MPNRSIPDNIKLNLIEEAGWKCANPGCSVTSRFEIHHIKEWAVYKTHDEKHMIAICPTCHANVHYNNSLIIEDSEIYQWKTIIRSKTNELITQFFVEPSSKCSLLFGPMKFISYKGMLPIKLADQLIEYKILDGKLYFINLFIKDQNGNPLCKANHNIIISNEVEGFTINKREGRLQIIADLSTGLLPKWALEDIRKFEPDFAMDNKLTVLDIKVEEPGTVSISNLVIVENNAAFVVKKDEYYFIKKGRVRPLIFSEVHKSLPILFPKELDYSQYDYIDPLVFLKINTKL
ncbi:HNH endonuclease signature motif containing protein [Ectobacillus sp. sgz5001026]|uniref:HNH endonuclease signature motif containing protein n=1 Tax=Ectobacillus sp. sgz5001026 TaxID=3242473 RepID=UPI0036D2D8CA